MADAETTDRAEGILTPLQDDLDGHDGVAQTTLRRDDDGTAGTLWVTIVGELQSTAVVYDVVTDHPVTIAGATASGAGLDVQYAPVEGTRA